jgi:hypothetical protein
MEQVQEVRVQGLAEEWEEEIILQEDLPRGQAQEENVYVHPVEQFKFIDPDNPVMR